MNPVIKLVDRLIAVSMMVAGAAVVLMMLHVTVDVASRIFLSWPLPGTTLIVSDYYMVACAFLPLAFAEKRNAHISMDLVTQFASTNGQRHLAAFAYLLSFAVFAVLTYSAALDAMTKYKINAFAIEFGTRIPIWPSYFLLPVGCALMTVLVAIRLVQYATGRLPKPAGS